MPKLRLFLLLLSIYSSGALLAAPATKILYTGLDGITHSTSTVHGQKTIGQKMASSNALKGIINNLNIIIKDDTHNESYIEMKKVSQAEKLRFIMVISQSTMGPISFSLRVALIDSSQKVLSKQELFKVLDVEASRLSDENELSEFRDLYENKLSSVMEEMKSVQEANKLLGQFEEVDGNQSDDDLI
jgi:hypothetical protein